METAPAETTAHMIALDIDGTLVGRDNKVPTETVQALELVRASGHQVVLATGRSLVGLVSIARRLGLTQGWAVGSNGALTVRLDPAAPSGYDVVEARTFAPGRVIRQASKLSPGVHVAVEEIGQGWRVSRQFAPGLLNGQQKQAPVADLCAEPATRVALHAPGIGHHLDQLRATDVTITPAGDEWADVTAPRTSKATTLERLRKHLRIEAQATVAVGDGANDREMLVWAARGVAMGSAPAVVQAAADEVTGTIDQHGAATVLRSLLPSGIEVATLSPLAGQLVTAVRAAPGSVVLRVWHDHRAEIALCDVWILRDGIWVPHGPILSGTGATMRGIELAAREAGLSYPRGQIGRRRAHWRSTRDNEGRVGFELPLHLERVAPRPPAASDLSMS